MVCGTQYFDKDVLPLGKENPFVGSRGTCAHRFSSAATGSLVELPLLPERQTVGGVVASIQNGKGKADNYSGADGRSEDDLPGTEIMLACPVCGTAMMEIGKDVWRTVA